jgi:hypothetical protein
MLRRAFQTATSNKRRRSWQCRGVGTKRLRWEDMKMRSLLLAKLAAGAIVTIVTSSSLLAAPMNGAAIIEALEMTNLVQDVGYCTRTDNRGRIISRISGHCRGGGVSCWSGIPHRSKFLHSGLCKRGEGGF